MLERTRRVECRFVKSGLNRSFRQAVIRHLPLPEFLSMAIPATFGTSVLRKEAFFLGFRLKTIPDYNRQAKK
jgi:hypothetical protein